jgi:AcrR family transcriptional regulator
LPREFVVRNQRDRIAAGIIATVAEHGYHEATVTRIVEAAGVSSRTFYTYFSTKEECYLDTFELIVDHLAGEMSAAVEAADARWPQTVEVRLRAMLNALADNPDLVLFSFVSLGSEGRPVDRHRRWMEEMLALLIAEMPADASAENPSPAAQQAVVGGISALLLREVRNGHGSDLAALAPSLVELVLTPYLGREAAARAISSDG